jgi:hypothetical protein
MPEMGEAIAFALFEPLSMNCPFKVEGQDTSEEEAEHPAKDDLEAAEEIQKNNGGTLGENLERGSPDGWGKAGTINDIFPPPDNAKDPQRDTGSTGKMITVRGVQYGYTVAAHHLIPGEASLAKSTLYKDYMKAGGSITTNKGKKYTIKTNIGYNVNGNHNGQWLPGNYAIRVHDLKKEPHKKDWNPTGKTWGTLQTSDPDWCYDYMLACVDQASGQFHDAHTKYNASAKDVLDKVRTALALHQDTECEQCKTQGEIYPPYVLKTRLYMFSKYLRMQVVVKPGQWRDPWITSDKFKEQLMKTGRIKEEPPPAAPRVIAL